MNKHLATALLLGVAVLVAGCNTTKGIGRDIKSVGKKIEDVAD